MYYCHAKGIIHWDLKLQNILFSNSLTDDPNKWEIKVVDFGISGYCKNNSAERTDAGTMKCMPPEWHSREQMNADPAADIW